MRTREFRYLRKEGLHFLCRPGVYRDIVLRCILAALTLYGIYALCTPIQSFLEAHGWSSVSGRLLLDFAMVCGAIFWETEIRLYVSCCYAKQTLPKTRKILYLLSLCRILWLSAFLLCITAGLRLAVTVLPYGIFAVLFMLLLFAILGVVCILGAMRYYVIFELYAASSAKNFSEIAAASRRIMHGRLCEAASFSARYLWLAFIAALPGIFPIIVLFYPYYVSGCAAYASACVASDLS